MPDNEIVVDTGTATTTTTVETPAAGDQGTETVDWKAKAREWERRAKDNTAAAAELAALKQAQMTEAQRLAAELEAARNEATTARAESLRYRVATQYGIGSDDAETFLTGTDEDTLTRQAERLAALAKASGITTPATTAARPDPSQGRTGTTSGASPRESFAAVIHDALTKG